MLHLLLLLALSRTGMGWGSGNGKAEVLNHAAGDVVACGANGAHPFAGKHVLIDVSGLAHKAACRGRT